MTAPDFESARTTLGWSHREVARRLGCNVVVPLRWSRGDAPVPVPVGVWLVALAKAVQRHPAPLGWRRRAAGTGD